MVNTLEAKVKELGQSSLREATVPILIQALGECNVNSMFLQEDSELQDWESRPEHVEEVMIGDTEYEVCALSSHPTSPVSHDLPT